MKPYNVEIFDRQFNLKYSTLIGENEFTYKFDLISPVKNNIYLPLDFKPEKISSEVNVPIGWYIRICRDDEEYQGVISGTEYEETRCKVEYKQLITIFDTNEVVSRDFSGSIENYIKARITANFISNTDTYQNLYGLNSNCFSTIETSTTGVLDYQKTDNENVNINILSDLILNAALIYNIITLVRIDFESAGSGRYFKIDIKKRGNNTRLGNIETSIGNSIDINASISDTKDKVNRADILDTYLSTTYRYYLHPDRTYNTTNSNRIVPVKDEDDFFSSESAAESWVNNYFQERIDAINQRYATRLDKLDKLYQGSWSRYYTDAQFDDFKDYLWDLEVYDEKNFRIDYAANSSYTNWLLKYDVTGNWVSLNDAIWEGWGEDCSYDFSDVSPSSIPSSCDSQLTLYGYWGRHDPEWDPFFRTYAIYKTPQEGFECHYLSNGTIGDYTGHIPIPGPSYEEESSPIIFQGYIDIKYSGASTSKHMLVEAYAPQQLFSDKINQKKQAALAAEETWQNENRSRLIQEKAVEISVSEAAKRAGSIFGKNTYSNLIEFMVSKYDPLICPIEMIRPSTSEIGLVMNVIHNGKSYNSVLTGMEIGAGKAKLIFGTVRLDLTKILNMKGV